MGRTGWKNSRDKKLWKMLSYFELIGNETTKTKEKRTLENTNTIKIEYSRQNWNFIEIYYIVLLEVTGIFFDKADKHLTTSQYAIY